MNSGPRLVFVVSMPRSGSTMLERMLSAHSHIAGGAEPHLAAPLAHTGYYAKVKEAPYDWILSAEAQRGFVNGLAGGEAVYWRACRAYLDTLYSAAAQDRPVFVDKTPANTLVLPFLAAVYPDAHYLVLSRHPAAVLVSHAESFFGGDYAEARRHNPVAERYVPAMADFVRRDAPDLKRLLLCYEDLVTEPEAWVERICGFLDLPHEPGMVEYARPEGKGLGDPVGVGQHRRPVQQSVDRWAKTLAAQPEARRVVEDAVNGLLADDLRTLGYAPESLWRPLEAVRGERAPTRRPRKWTRYGLQRAAIVRGRAWLRRWAGLRRLVDRIRLACDVLLRP